MNLWLSVEDSLEDRSLMSTPKECSRCPVLKMQTNSVGKITEQFDGLQHSELTSESTTTQMNLVRN